MTKDSIAARLIILAREEKGKLPTELNFEEQIDVVYELVKKLNIADFSGMFPALNTVKQEIDRYNEKTMQGSKGHFQNGINWAFNHIAKQIKK